MLRLIALAIVMLPQISDADVAVQDFDLGVQAGYTFVETGQVTHIGPQLGYTPHVGPITLRGEYAYLVWLDDHATHASGHEHALTAAAQLDFWWRRDPQVHSRWFLQSGVTAQWLSLEQGSEANMRVFVGAGLDVRARMARLWSGMIGITMDLRVMVGPAIGVRDDVIARRTTPEERGRDWSFLWSISQGLSF
jgi:hypothetical protein